MTRQEFSKATKRAAFERSDGYCEGKLPNGLRCSVPLKGKPIEYDHDTPDYMGGSNELGNCLVLCRICHGDKTKRERPMLDRTRRITDKGMGIRKRRTITKWRRFDGTIVHASRER